MIDPSCCIKKNEGKIVYSLRMIRVKLLTRAYTLKSGKQKKFVILQKKTPMDMETLTHTKSLWIRKFGQIWNP